MPTYEFRCSAGHKFEIFYRKISDSLSTADCPTCGQPAQRQVSGGAGLVFKGGGFYITDYGKDGKKDQRDAAARASEPKPASESTEKKKEASEAGGASKDSSKSEPASGTSSRSPDAGSKTDKGSSSPE